MNYEEQVRAMLRHASEQHTDPKASAVEMGKVVEALGKGIAIVALGLPDQAKIPFVVEVSQAISAQITEYQLTTQNLLAVSAEHFLRDVFKPEKFHG